MIKVTILFFGGYLIMLLVLVVISKWDDYTPSIFGKWSIILTPIYIIVFFLLYYIFKKKTNEKTK